MAKGWSPLWILIPGIGGLGVIGYPVNLVADHDISVVSLAWLMSYMGAGMYFGSGVERLLRSRVWSGHGDSGTGSASDDDVRDGSVCLVDSDVGAVRRAVDGVAGAGHGSVSVFAGGGCRLDVCCSGSSFVVFWTRYSRSRLGELREDVWQASATGRVGSGDDVPVNFWGVRSPFPDAGYPRSLFVDRGQVDGLVDVFVRSGERGEGVVWLRERDDSGVVTIPGLCAVPKEWSNTL
ncbi:hypothetical protein [Bifidobacterium aquikefiricola]|uniref:Uncharacterized protein n=1 Tax=Bifidobacterium aquikefiricola TaxID=3059038 RepID=A0AB39U523_9BIFI